MSASFDPDLFIKGSQADVLEYLRSHDPSEWPEKITIPDPQQIAVVFAFNVPMSASHVLQTGSKQFYEKPKHCLREIREKSAGGGAIGLLELLSFRGLYGASFFIICRTSTRNRLPSRDNNVCSCVIRDLIRISESVTRRLMSGSASADKLQSHDELLHHVMQTPDCLLPIQNAIRKYIPPDFDSANPPQRVQYYVEMTPQQYTALHIAAMIQRGVTDKQQLESIAQQMQSVGIPVDLPQNPRMSLSEARQALYQAIMYDWVDVVRALLTIWAKNDHDVLRLLHNTDDYCIQPLQLATGVDSLGCLQELLKALRAVKASISPSVLPVHHVNRLLQKRNNEPDTSTFFRILHYQSLYIPSPLLNATLNLNYDMVKLLLDAGAIQSEHRIEPAGISLFPFIVASIAADDRLVKLFISYLRHPDRLPEYASPVILVLPHQQVAVQTVIGVAEYSSRFLGHQRCTCYDDQVFVSQSEEVIEEALFAICATGHTTLYRNARRGITLKALGALSNAMFSPIQAAVVNNHTELLQAIHEDFPDIVPLLTDPGTTGGTMLNHAVIEDNREMVQLLLDIGVDPLYSDGVRPAVEDAIAFGHLAIFRMFTQRGFDPVTYKNAKQQTLLHIAAQADSREAAELLVSSGIDINALEVGAQSALLTALEQEHFQLAEFLLDSGASASAGDTAASGPRCATSAICKYNVAILEKLLQNGTVLPPDALNRLLCTLDRFFVRHQNHSFYTNPITDQLDKDAFLSMVTFLFDHGCTFTLPIELLSGTFSSLQELSQDDVFSSNTIFTAFFKFCIDRGLIVKEEHARQPAEDSLMKE